MPVLWEYRVWFIRINCTIAEPSAHIVDAGHVAAPAAAGNPVPIMESRVTSPASAASSMPPVPSGRIGSTR